ncbi:MAG: class GN sortase [Gammaproteobacteria bacterium]|jgi:sortase A|nr:class GN sortase [Gammaproteobacteria bacterium]
MFRRAGINRWSKLLALCLLLAGLHQLAAAGLIQAKAKLAPVLIERAWGQSLKLDGAPVKPWPWADTWPVARLAVPVLAVDLPVLAGDSGNVLAFGPGHALASAVPGSPGLTVIGGHRDTHFAFLENLPAGALVQLELPTGELRNYRAETLAVVNAEHNSLPLQSAAGESLLLVTCYPFGALRVGGPLRYVVHLVPHQSDLAAALRPG